MFSSVSFRSGLDEMRREIASVDADCLTGTQAAALVESLSALISAAEAARGLCARRVQMTSLHTSEGRRSAAGWLADKGGMSLGEAQVALDTAARLIDQPVVETAFRMGQISADQAASVVKATALSPDSGASLVASAQNLSLKELRATCRRVEADAGADHQARIHDQLHRSRYFRHWTEANGAVRFTGQLAPDDGARVIAALDSATDRHFRAARREGRREAPQCYSADAFVELMSSGGEASTGLTSTGLTSTGLTSTGRRSTGPRAMVHVTVSYDALRRGHVASGESCEIAGVGPVPVATAKALMADSILKVLVTKGADVYAVAGKGRTIPASVKTALIQRDSQCVVPHCDVRQGLEIDHIRPFGDGGPSELANLCRLCRYHHSMKTHRGFIITGSPGQWKWEPPAAKVLHDTG